MDKTYEKSLDGTKACDGYCGNCCYFKHEDTDGFGLCYNPDVTLDEVRCSDESCRNYLCIDKARHYIAVLMQFNRYRRDNDVPSIYRMPDQAEIGKAIDFGVKYMKLFMEM